ncbi:MAG: transporter [Bacteroidota bacterium]
MKFIFLTWAFFSTAILSLAQVLEDLDPLVTDRPGQGTDAPTVLSPGRVQVELGFLYQEDPDASQRLFLYPNTLVRIGLVERVEFRVSADLFQEGTGQPTFLSPIVLGTKVGLTKNKGLIPESALIVNVTMPREGPIEVWNPIATPELRLLMSHALSNRLALTTNLGIVWENDPVSIRYPNHSYAASLDISVNDYVAAFTEFYGFWSQLEQSHLFNMGGAILLLPDLQLDISGGVAFSDSAPDYFLSSGVSVRF